MTTKKQTKAKQVNALLVNAPKKGLRRAGRYWAGETIVAIDELSEEQVEQLKNEDAFVVVETTMPVEEAEPEGEDQ